MILKVLVLLNYFIKTLTTLKNLTLKKKYLNYHVCITDSFD